MKKIKKLGIKNGLLAFFGIHEPFFKTAELKGKDLQRFADRKNEITAMRNALECRQNFAVIGGTGTGKSTLLLKFQQEIDPEYYTEYIYFSMNSKTDDEMKEEFFRDILARILIIIIDNDEIFDSFDPEEIHIETNRLNYSITIEDLEKKQFEINPEIESNIPKLLKSSFLPIKLDLKLNAKIGKEKQTTTTKQFPRHTENTLKESIGKITKKLPAPMVFFIDEMDRIMKTVRAGENWIDEVVKLLRYASEIMTNENLLFFFALQPEIKDIFLKAYKRDGDDSILRYVPVFTEIKGFDIDFAKEAVAESLKFCGYKRKPLDLFPVEVMEIVLSAASGNPRKFMLYLTELVKIAYNKEKKTVTKDMVKEYLEGVFGVEGKEDWRGFF